MTTLEPSMVPALVLAAYGSAGAGPIAELYGDLVYDARAAFPSMRVELAIVSEQVRRALAERGEDAPSLPDVLTALARDGARRVVVQPILVGAGLTLDAIQADADRARGTFDALTVGEPLLVDEAGATEVARALLTTHPAGSGQAVLLVAHGSGRGDGGCGYLARALVSLDDHGSCEDSVREATGSRQAARYVIATLTEGAETAAARLRAQVPDATAVTLVPLMLVAGAHVRRQLAGEANRAASESRPSWQAALARRGYAVGVCTEGLLDLAAVRRLFVRHAGCALAALEYEGDAR